MTRKNETRFTAALCLLMAALLVLLCSQSSPLYPINLWDDANCLLTVGRVMRAGGVLYRDIYEQKGPTLYLLHWIAACISDNSFFGVYVMETLAAAATLLFACRLLRLRMSPCASIAGACLPFALLLTSASFARGDSAEEFCLPFLAAALYVAFAEYDRSDGPMRAPRLFVCGLLAGAVATIKYTALGLFIGLCLCEGLLALRAGGIKRAAKSALAFLAGMALPVALWCAYFAANGALGDFFTAYVTNNVFLYDAGSGAADALREVLRIARDNALWLLPAALGVGLFALFGREKGALRLCAALTAACAAACALGLGRLWPYCALTIGAVLPVALLGWRAPVRRAEPRRQEGRAMGRAASLACVALSLLLAWVVSPNAFLRGVPLSEIAQGRLAAQMEPGATLLQYSHLDDGLYLASGALPRGKYFVRLNVRYGEMIDALDGYVARGEPDYVLISWRELPEEFARYELIAQDTAYDDANRLNKALYLYRRKAEVGSP